MSVRFKTKKKSHPFAIFLIFGFKQIYSISIKLAKNLQPYKIPILDFLNTSTLIFLVMDILRELNGKYTFASYLLKRIDE